MTIGLRLNPQLWGWYPQYYSSFGAFVVNAAGTWSALGVLLDTTRTLNKVRVWCTTSGSPIAADFRCELYSHSGTTGAPNASLQTATVPASISNGAWIEWTGLSTSLTAGTMYWLVFKNLNATPGTNFYSISVHGSTSATTPTTLLGAVGGDPTTNWGWGMRRTLNSGTAWATSPITACGTIRLEFADGYFAGFPLGATNTQLVYSAREAGAYVISPDVPLNVTGINMPIVKTGTPTGFVRYRLYIGSSASPTLIGTTGSLPSVATVVTTPFGYYPLYFSSPITIPPSSPIRVVLSETTQSDVSTNRYNALAWDIENDANTKALMGSIQSTLSTDGGATFAETDTIVAPFALTLTNTPGGGTDYSSPSILPLYRYRRGQLT